jgi:hypothetical protein
MKHVKLFEHFSGRDSHPELFKSSATPSEGTNYKAIGVFLETEMAVGVFPSEKAESIYYRLSRKITPDMDHMVLEMTDLPDDHDLVIVPMGGRDISTSNEDELANYGSPATEIIELGKMCDFYGKGDEAGYQMVFKADKNIKGFVVADYTGHTRLETPEAIINRI